MVRLPAVAGRFYPDKPAALSSMIEGFLDPSLTKHRALGMVVPHAGYMYSGHVAGAVYSCVQLPSRFIILCPNHTGMGPPLSINRQGSWRTPLGDMEIDSELSRALMTANPHLEDDSRAHQLEHALEVQLPFLQYIEGQSVRFVPIVVGTSNWTELETLGETIGKVVREVDETTLIVASSDMNHYEPDAPTRIKDAKAIDQVLKLQARGLYETVLKERISMCGFGPTTAMITATTMLGAQRAELIKYATSAEISGDYERVVGYAGIIVS
jgi:AmmeMemoRadiSam system protein B